MKIHILGSLSGTEPFPSRNHTSWALELDNGNIYLFDAGENCSRTAYLSQMDLMQIKAVFISHSHYDHIGGLCGLFWHMRKLCNAYEKESDFKKVELIIPELEAWEAIKMLLSYTEGGYFKNLKFDIVPKKPTATLAYEDENIKVYAYPSHHEPDRADGTVRTYSYRIEASGFSIVYSGDFKSLDDICAPVGDGCDLLLSETGHHKVSDVCRFAETHAVGELVFYHHGREILGGSPTVAEAIKACPVKATLSYDGMEIVR